MRRIATALTVVLVGLLATVGLAAVEERLAVAEMAEAAGDFLDALSDEQRARATFAFTSDERERFHFIPPEIFERHGVVLKEMSAEQKERAHDLLRAGLSRRGYMTATEIMEVEGILAGLEGPDRRFRRDAEDYWVSVFGTPSTDGTWGWRFEGHHLSLHFTVVDGEVTVSTPGFFGANPAEVPEGPRQGLRPLSRQEDLARRLLASLDPDQRDAAIFDDVAPTNVVTGVDLVVDPLDPVGIRASELRPRQRTMLVQVIEAWASIMDEDIAALRMAEVRAGGTDDITFAWAGGTERGEVGYYRIQGPRFLIEFDFTQEDPNHIHAAWRDFDGDLGRDLLREHLERDHR